MAPPKLPQPTTPFVGRQHELAEIARLLDDPDCRLLTLVGPGGIGKTRLALEVVRPLAFADGIRFVDLQPISTSELLITTIANALGILLSGAQAPHEQLLNYLGDRDLLLLLDNFEHLWDSVDLLADILNSAPGVKLLVTSREALNVPEEWVWQVEGLQVPDALSDDSIEIYSAVQLFVSVVQRLRQDFTLAGQESSIRRTCQLVEGMPLALEMAASWIKVLSCAEIAGEIQRSLDFLTTSMRNVPERHRSMEAVFDHSWCLLSEAERQVFPRLSVFRGGFRREAAEQVAGASLKALASLVDKSFLRVDISGRYRIHELLRQYGGEQLARSGNPAATHEAHCAYYSEFLDRRELDLKGRRQVEALNEIEADFENVRAAWHWSLERRNDKAINQSIESLALYCEMRSRFHEADALFQPARQTFAPVPGEEPPPVWGRVLSHAVGPWGEDKAVQRERYETALAIALRSGNQVERGYCLWRLGELANGNREGCALEEGSEDFAGVVSLLEQSLANFTKAQDHFYVAKVLNEIGLCHRERGQLEKAIGFHQRSLDLRREIGDERSAAWCHNDMGEALHGLGRYAEAEPRFQQAKVVWRKLNDRFGYGVSAGNLASLALLRGDFELARALAKEALEISFDLKEPRTQTFPLAILGAIAGLEENYSEGMRLCEQSLSLPIYPTMQSFLKWSLAIATCGLGNDLETKRLLVPVLSAPLVDGRLRCLPIAAVLLAHEGELHQTVDLLALVSAYPGNLTAWLDKWPLLTRLRAQLEADLGAAAYAATWERGARGNLEAATASIFPHFQLESEAATPAAKRKRGEQLSQRELEILHQMSAGLTNQEIADQLVIGVSTVKKHITHIYGKLGASDRIKAVIRARALGLLPSSTL